MNAKRSGVALAFFLLFAASRPHAADQSGLFVIHAVDNLSCGLLTRAVAGSLIEESQLRGWLAGYLTRYNQDTAGVMDILWGTNLDGAWAWVRNDCLRSPAKLFTKSVDDFIYARLAAMTFGPPGAGE